MHHFTWNPKSHAIFSHTPSPPHSLPPPPTAYTSRSFCLTVCMWFSIAHHYCCRWCLRDSIGPFLFCQPFLHIFFFCVGFVLVVRISFTCSAVTGVRYCEWFFFLFRIRSFASNIVLSAVGCFFFITHFSCQVVAIWMCLSVAHLPTLNSSAINSLIATEQWAVSKKKREQHTHTWRSRSVVWFPSTCTKTTGHMAHRIMCELSVEVVQDVVVSGSEQENHDDSRSSGRVYGKANI